MSIRTSVRVALPVATLLVACTGGGGSLSDGIVSQDPSPNSTEGVSATQEAAAHSNEGIAASQERAGADSVEQSPAAGGGVVDCNAKYSCTITAGGKSSATKLSFKNGACVDDETALTPDGTVREKGVAVGTWHATANGFALTATIATDNGSESVDLDCTKGASNGDDDDDVPPVPDGGAG